MDAYTCVHRLKNSLLNNNSTLCIFILALHYSFASQIFKYYQKRYLSICISCKTWPGHLSGSLNPAVILSAKIYSKLWKKIAKEIKTKTIRETWTKSKPYHKMILSITWIHLIKKCSKYSNEHMTSSYVNQKNQPKIILSDFQFINFFFVKTLWYIF